MAGHGARARCRRQFVSCSDDRSDTRAACRAGRTRRAGSRRASPAGAVDALVGRPEDRHDRHAERRREVHRARVVRHERGAPRDHADELRAGSVRPIRFDDARARRQRRFYRTPRVAVGAGADQHATRRRAAHEPGDHLRDRDRAATAWRGRRPRRARSRRAVVPRATPAVAQQRVGLLERRRPRIDARPIAVRDGAFDAEPADERRGSTATWCTCAARAGRRRASAASRVRPRR